MEKIDWKKALKDYENVSNNDQFHVNEIMPHAAKQVLSKSQDFGSLDTSAVQMGMGMIRAKTWKGQFIVDFLNKATIHGLNHIVAPRRHFVERFLTILFLLIGLACSVVSSIYSWHQYRTNPTSMVVDLNFEHFNVTKPAMTVCLMNKISTDKFPAVFQKYGVKDTEIARQFFTFISKPQYETMNQAPMYNDTPPENWLAILRDLYFEITELECIGGEESCEGMQAPMTVIVTEKGICSIFYGAYDQYATLEYWLANDWTVSPQAALPEYTYARRNERISINNIRGPYEMMFHHPNEIPEYGESWNEYMLPGMIDLRIDVLQIESSNDVRKLSITQRPCNYPEDGGLEMWPVYTHNMCIIECRYNFIKSKCGCWPYFARPIAGTPICNASQLRCIGEYSSVVILLKEGDVHLCECPDSCNATRYKVLSIGQTGLHEEKWSAGVSQVLADRVINIDMEFPFHKMRHEVFFGFNEFLVGGAAGLFLGASIISFVEMVYYASIRLFWYRMNIRKV